MSDEIKARHERYKKWRDVDIGKRLMPCDERRLHEDIAHLLKERDELRALLKFAACPANCTDYQVPPDGHQCQFCSERDELLKGSDDE